MARLRVQVPFKSNSTMTVTTPTNSPAESAAATEADYLDEDMVKVAGQNYALISFVTKVGKQRTEHEKMGIKLRGCFSTKEEAQAHIRKLMKTDNLFDVYLVEMWKWLGVPPNNDDIENHEYSEQFLQDMVKEYKESQENAKQHFMERKQAIMEKGLDANLLPEERLPQPPEGAEVPTGHGASTSSSQ